MITTAAPTRMAQTAANPRTNRARIFSLEPAMRPIARVTVFTGSTFAPCPRQRRGRTRAITVGPLTKWGDAGRPGRSFRDGIPDRDHKRVPPEKRRLPATVPPRRRRPGRTRPWTPIRKRPAWHSNYRYYPGWTGFCIIPRCYFVRIAVPQGPQPPFVRVWEPLAPVTPKPCSRAIPLFPFRLNDAGSLEVSGIASGSPGGPCRRGGVFSRVFPSSSGSPGVSPRPSRP